LGDRFRLIYLKSKEFETDDKSIAYPGSEEISGKASSHKHPSATSLSKTILKQAEADLKHPDPKIKVLAIRYLERLDSSVVFPLLQETLSDRNPEVRLQALSSLIKFRNPSVCPFLKKYLKDTDPRVRVTALRGLFYYYNESIDLNLLLQLLSDESSWVRRKVATLLGWTHREGAFPILTEMSKDPDSNVRKAALFSLVTLYPDESENRLMEAAIDPDPTLRQWARSTLEKMIARPLKERKNLLLSLG